MAAADHAPIDLPAFAVRRRGYDPDQVVKHLDRLDAEIRILAADRAAAVEQADQLSTRLSACRAELDAAHAEIDRLRDELRRVAETPDTVESMNERLQVMLRLARDEFGGLRAEAAAGIAAHTADIIAAVGREAGTAAGLEFDEFELHRPRDESELEQLRRAAAAERSRLDEEAAARRAAAEEEFRRTLTLRCREAMAQLTALQAEALRSAQRLIDDADAQARNMLADAREAVRCTIDDAQREVDEMHELRQRLAHQLDSSRKLLDGAMPTMPATAPEPDRTAGNPAASNGAADPDRAAAHRCAPVIPAAAPVGPPPVHEPTHAVTAHNPHPSGPAEPGAAAAAPPSSSPNGAVAAAGPNGTDPATGAGEATGTGHPAAPVDPAVVPAAPTAPPTPTPSAPPAAAASAATAPDAPAGPPGPDDSAISPPPDPPSTATDRNEVAAAAASSDAGASDAAADAAAGTASPDRIDRTDPPATPAPHTSPVVPLPSPEADAGSNPVGGYPDASSPFHEEGPSVPGELPAEPSEAGSTAATPPPDVEPPVEDVLAEPAKLPEERTPAGWAARVTIDHRLPRAQPVRIPPRDPAASDLPVPVEEREPRIAAPRRYP